MSEESNKLFDRNIKNYNPLISPAKLKEMFPLTPEVEKTVWDGRTGIEQILDGKDSRLLIVSGPCSIHDVKEAYEYSQKLKTLAEKVKNRFHVVMRTYFEKPRTNHGWPGLIEDPYLNGSNQNGNGLKLAMKLLLDINGLGLPTATEFLNTQTAQYIGEIISYAAIGARTTEAQDHRKMSSGLSMPVGMKNSTDGRISVAIDGVKVARFPNNFRGIDNEGRACSINTLGNPYSHILLRGGVKPNYDTESIASIEKDLQKNGLSSKLVIDCSHGNSGKDYNQQPHVFYNVINQIINGNSNIAGIMLESYLQEGKQSISNNLKYGVSITDACIGWETTERIILEAYEKIEDYEKNKLSIMREKIDQVDHELMAILSKRKELIGQVAEYKRDHDIPLYHLEREEQLLAERKQLAKKLGVDQGAVERIFGILLEYSHRTQHEILIKK